MAGKGEEDEGVPWAAGCGGDHSSAYERQVAVSSAFLASTAVCVGALVCLLLAGQLHRRDEIRQQQQSSAPPPHRSQQSRGQQRQQQQRSAKECLAATKMGLASLPRTDFWRVCMLSVATACDNNFPNFGADVLIEHWGYDTTRAGALSSLFPLCFMFFIPAIGGMYDHTGGGGYRVLGASIGCLLFMAAWLALTLGADPARGGMLPPDLQWAGLPWVATVGQRSVCICRQPAVAGGHITLSIAAEPE